MSKYHHYHSHCSDNKKSGSLHGVFNKVLDAQFAICRYLTHKTVDCIESFLYGCHSQHNCHNRYRSHQHGYSIHEDELGCIDDMCCQIPEPCWMPKSLGEYHCEVCDSGKVSLTLLMTNEDYLPRTYKLSRRGDTVGKVNFSVNELRLQPKERTKVTVTFDAPNKPSHCDVACYDLLIWIDSCRDYYLRWVICTSHKPNPCCLEVPLLDRPDYVVHWYDHFYCQRHCCSEVA
ncbi:MAG: hypothetical protein MI976_02590 [Pseudomonadales bacterium]|nr:hypothetical protein [Pseudomonadales bacterium]